MFLLKLSENSSTHLGSEKMFFSLRQKFSSASFSSYSKHLREMLDLTKYRLVVWERKIKKSSITLPEATLLFKIKSKHHLVVLYCVLLPISLIGDHIDFCVELSCCVQTTLLIPKSKSRTTLHIYQSQLGLYEYIKVTSRKPGPRIY